MTGRRGKGLAPREAEAAFDRMADARLKRKDPLSQAQGQISRMAAEVLRARRLNAEAKRVEAVARYRRMEIGHRAKLARGQAPRTAEAGKMHGECTGDTVPVHGQGRDGAEGRRKAGK